MIGTLRRDWMARACHRSVSPVTAQHPSDLRRYQVAPHGRTLIGRVPSGLGVPWRPVSAAAFHGVFRSGFGRHRARVASNPCLLSARYFAKVGLSICKVPRASKAIMGSDDGSFSLQIR